MMRVLCWIVDSRYVCEERKEIMKTKASFENLKMKAMQFSDALKADFRYLFWSSAKFFD